MRHIFSPFHPLFLSAALIGLLAYPALAQNDPNSGYVASSTNYLLQSDSVNFGGGLGTSTNYRLESTLGEISSIASTTERILSSGYQAMSLDTFVEVTAPSAIALSPDLESVGGGPSTGSGSWNVVTNNAAGYSLAVRADSTPALAAGSDSFADYDPIGSDPDYLWAIPAAESFFGYSPEGDDIVDRFLDNGISCDSGASNTSERCWDGFSTSDVTIAAGSADNYPAGADITLKLQAEIGTGKTQVPASYQANIIVTIVSL